MGICTQVCIDKFGWKRGAVKGSTFVVDDHAMKCGSYRLEETRCGALKTKLCWELPTGEWKEIEWRTFPLEIINCSWPIWECRGKVSLAGVYVKDGFEEGEIRSRDTSQKTNVLVQSPSDEKLGGWEKSRSLKILVWMTRSLYTCWMNDWTRERGQKFRVKAGLKGIDGKFGFRQTKFIVMTEYGGGGPQEAAGDVRLIRAVRAVDIGLELIPREVNV